MMNFNNRINKMMKLINTDDGKKPTLTFNEINKDLYSITLDHVTYEISKKDLEEFKKDYGTDNVVSIFDNIPKGNDYIPLDK